MAKGREGKLPKQRKDARVTWGTYCIPTPYRPRENEMMQGLREIDEWQITTVKVNAAVCFATAGFDCMKVRKVLSLSKLAYASDQQGY